MSDAEITRDMIFSFITAKGGDECVVHFTGGHDEGGVETIEIRKKGMVVEELDEYPEDPVEEKIMEEIIRPMYDKYYTFAGEFSVDGFVIWDCDSKTVKIQGSEEVSTDFQEEV